MTLRVDENEVLLALLTLHTTSYIDKGEASIIFWAVRPLHTTSYIDKDGKMVFLALHTTSYNTSTKAKHPSSQTEKLCPETEFESYKALLVAVVLFEL